MKSRNRKRDPVLSIQGGTDSTGCPFEARRETVSGGMIADTVWVGLAFSHWNRHEMSTEKALKHERFLFCFILKLFFFISFVCPHAHLCCSRCLEVRGHTCGSHFSPWLPGTELRLSSYKQAPLLPWTISHGHVIDVKMCVFSGLRKWIWKRQCLAS